MKRTSVVRQALQTEDWLKIRQTNLHPNFRKATYFKKPVVVSHASMQYIYDTEGKKYLDLFGGIVTVSVGHCHPKVNDALIQQAKKLWHTTAIYVTGPVHEYAQELVATMPGDLKVVYPVNSGSEANDLAILMARIVTGNFDVIALRNGYHGMSPLTMGLTGHSTWKQAAPHYMGIHHAMNPDVYRGLWTGIRDSPVQVERKSDCPGCMSSNCKCDAALNYVKQLEEVFTYSLPQKRVAAFIAESIQGVGGTVQYPNGYLKQAFELTRKNGGVCISDEVQTGFGRTGDNFWHFQDHGVLPDIVTMAKGQGNGFPMAAVVTTPKIAECMSNAAHFNTFGGNPLASAVAKSVLEVIKEEKLQENSKQVGTYFLEQLAKFRSDFEMVGDVRGKGLMIGMEMVENKETRQPLALEKMLNIFEDFKDAGILMGRGGHYGSVFRVKPPMCVTKADLDFALDKMRTVLKKHAQI